MTADERPRRGRKPLPADQRKPRLSGAHRSVDPSDILDQRRALRDAALASIPDGCSRALVALRELMAGDEPLLEPLPAGAPTILADLLGLPKAAGADRARKMWAGRLVFHARRKNL